MTEELEKEAEEYVKQNYCDLCVMADDCKSGCIDCFTVQAYIASAEPREKQIQIDAKQIRALQKQNGELTDKVKELKEQLGNLYEIIKRPYQFTAPRKIQMVKEAEQLLKEE